MSRSVRRSHRVRHLVLGTALLLATAGPAWAEGEPPALYRRIAAKHGLSAARLYDLALRRSGRQSRFAPTPTPAPWPWTVRLCLESRCETVYPATRAVMAQVLDAGRRAGLTLYVGPLGLRWDGAALPLRAATSPRVTVNEAARQLARTDPATAAAPPAGTPGPAAGAALSTALARRWAPLVERVAREEGLAPALVHAVVAAESGYDPAAVSPKGAVGLMQLMPETAERFGLPRAARDDPERNLRAGIGYLRWLIGYFDGDLALALAGYNAGEHAVAKYGRRIPPYPETQTYVRRVANHLARYAATTEGAPKS